MSSVSSAGSLKWEYIRPGLGRTGRSLSENNFAKEGRDRIAILLREVLQNALDARVSRDIPVTVSMACRTLDESAAAWMRHVIDDDHLRRFSASMPHVRGGVCPPPESCLVIEDFGTSGLTGSVDDPNLDGAGQNWNAFWFREGEGGKENTSGNGGAGQGKITYFSTSAMRTIFVYTVCADNGQEALMGACSFLRDYDHEGHKWKRDAYWGLGRGDHEDRIVLPTRERDQIDAFRSRLSLKRKPDQPGMSLVIPSPKEFDPKIALQVVIAEFFVPLLRGDLVVQLHDITLNKTTVQKLADQLLSDDRARDLHTCMTRGYRDFIAESLARSVRGEVVLTKPVAKVADISEGIFVPEDLARVRQAIDSECVVSVRVPIAVKSKEHGVIDCHFDVHLACPFDLDRAEQAVIRRDLLIGEEPIGGGRLRQKARGLTLVGNDALSRLLLSAEEATHLRWNTRLPRLAEYYRAGPETVSVVRNGMAKILDVVTGGDQRRDFKLLAKYFAAPGLESPTKARGRIAKKGNDIGGPKVDIPPAKPKLLVLEALEDGCRVRPDKADVLTEDVLPLKLTIEFAYEGLDRDALSEYDPLDFDLSDSEFKVRARGCSINLRSLNRLEAVVENPDFELSVAGFSRNLRLRMRLSYEEVADAAAIDSE